MNTLEYLLTSLIVYFGTLVLFALPGCCKRNKNKKKKSVSKNKKKGGAGKHKQKKQRKHSTATPATTPMTMTTTPVTFPAPLTPTGTVLTPVSQTPQKAQRSKPVGSEEVIKPEEDEKKSKKSEQEKEKPKEKEEVDLLRCRDYTPENLGEFKYLFDLLD